MNLTAAKVAAVTGGGAGIGEAICHRLSAEGAQVAVIDLSLPAAQATVDAIGSGMLPSRARCGCPRGRAYRPRTTLALELISV
jgi:NAD(P)-dependent dehydrogenase (short-subunit alcohol dehydrogenase family)